MSKYFIYLINLVGKFIIVFVNILVYSKAMVRVGVGVGATILGGPVLTAA